MVSNMEQEKKPTIICFCEDISKKEIIEAIERGYTTPEAIKRHLRCGMGACQGRGCMELIAGIIARKTDKSMEDLVIHSSRPPIKPLPIGLAALGDEEEE